MGKIYLDTNVFFKNGYFRSEGAQAKLKACVLAGYDVVLPEVVIDEVIGNFEKELSQSKDNLQKSLNAVNKIVSIKVDEIDVNAETQTYKIELELMINQLGIEVLPYPSVTTKELVIASYKGKKPFDVNGKGHKDYIIWTTIMDHMLSDVHDGPFLFISHNTGDFGIGKGKKNQDNSYELHSHLAEQVKPIEEHLTCYTDLQSALEHAILLELKGLTLEDVKGKSAMVEYFVEQSISKSLPYTSMDNLEGVPFSDLIITSYGHPENIKTTFYKFEDSYMAQISGSSECLIDGYINKSDYFSEELPYVSISPCNDHVFEAQTEANVEFEITAIYNPETQSLSGQTFTITNEIENDWYN